VPLLCRLERLYPADLARFETQLARSGGRRPLLLRVASALPRDERAADTEQRCRVLGDHGQRRESPRRHQVIRRRPLLRPATDDCGVPQAGCGDRALHERALAPDALDEGDPCSRQGRGEREAGEPRAGAQIRDGRGAADDVELEGRERVRHVHVDAALRLPDRRRRRVVLRHEREDRRQRGGPGRPHVEARRERLQAGLRRVGERHPSPASREAERARTVAM
jgi:hypothetical protein